MADEPRRSGRATKGQHTKNDDLHETQPLKKGKGKPKATKKDVETEDEEEDENATIRCICEVQEDIEGMMMICCDKCEAWQHNVCMGITEVKAELPKQYFCEACRPQNHKELLDDIQAGAKPEEVAARRREERKKKGKKGKTVKKAKVTEQSKAPEVKSEADSEVATPVTQSNIEESIETKNQSLLRRRSSTNLTKDVEAPTKDQGVPCRRSSTNLAKVAEAPTKKRKASTTGIATATPSRKVSKLMDPTVLVNNISELTDTPRLKAATQFLKQLSGCIIRLSANDKFRIPDGDTPASLGERIAIRVEHECYMKYAADTGEYSKSYKDMMLQICFNVPKNDRMTISLLDGTLQPETLVTMSSDDMANDELKLVMATMKAQSDKQNILVQDNGPRIRRTHKGDEVVENQWDNVSSEAITPSFNADRRPSSAMSMSSDFSKASTGAGSPDMPPPASIYRRKSSSTFDNNPSSSNQRRSSQLSGQRDLPAFDRSVFLDDGIDHTLFPIDEKLIVWRGSFGASTHSSSFDIAAHHVAGSNLRSREMPLSNLFPKSLEIEGVLREKKGDEYICSLAPSPNTDVCVFELTLQREDTASKEEFQKLFAMLLTRTRYASIKVTHPVRDAYIVPLDRGPEKLPEFIKRLGYSKVMSLRPQVMLLAVFVIKWPPASNMTPQVAGAAASGTISRPAAYLDEAASSAAIAKASSAAKAASAARAAARAAATAKAAAAAEAAAPKAAVKPVQPDADPRRRSVSRPLPTYPDTMEMAFSPRTPMDLEASPSSTRQQRVDAAPLFRPSPPASLYRPSPPPPVVATEEDIISLAQAKLGHYYLSRVPQQILRESLANEKPLMSELWVLGETFEGILNVVKRNPAAMDDMEVLRMELAKDAAMTKG